MTPRYRFDEEDALAEWLSLRGALRCVDLAQQRNPIAGEGRSVA